MRILVASLLASTTFGCDDRTPAPPPDAAAVAPVDAAIATCGKPGSLEGCWRLQWTCIDCPRGAYNPLQYSDRLDVAGTLLTYSSSHGCIECGAIHIGERVGTCIAIPDDNGEQRSQYQLCPTTGGVEAAIEWSGYPGPPAPRRWRLSGTRL